MAAEGIIWPADAEMSHTRHRATHREGATLVFALLPTAVNGRSEPGECPGVMRFTDPVRGTRSAQTGRPQGSPHSGHFAFVINCMRGRTRGGFYVVMAGLSRPSR